MQLTEVAFRYGRRSPWVLRSVSADLPPGRIIEITGSNGAGKSTLLRLAARLLRPGAGRVSGRPAVVGYAPERFPAAQPFPLAAYLRHMARLRGVPYAGAEEHAVRLGLGGLLAVPLPELSKGSAQKAGLAQALVGDPGLLVLDEPFAGLDPAARGLLPPLLLEQAARGATVLVCDHQGGLRDLPGVDRLVVSGGTVTPVRAAAATAVIEIAVPAAEAAATALRLRAEGHTVRSVRLESPPDPSPGGASGTPPAPSSGSSAGASANASPAAQAGDGPDVRGEEA